MEMTEAQYRDLKDYINQPPPAYSLVFGAHCSHWALNALVEAGLLPDVLVPGPEVGDPRFGIMETAIWNPITMPFWMPIYEVVNEFFNRALSWIEARRDPVTLDLDGDGLETVGINTAAPILFDHDGDGIKTGTGWVMPTAEAQQALASIQGAEAVWDLGEVA